MANQTIVANNLKIEPKVSLIKDPIKISIGLYSSHEQRVQLTLKVKYKLKEGNFRHCFFEKGNQ
jgi:hypothetical protein